MSEGEREKGGRKQSKGLLSSNHQNYYSSLHRSFICLSAAELVSIHVLYVVL